MDLKLYVGERLYGTEPLGDPAQRQHGRSGHVNHLLRRLTRREVVQKCGRSDHSGAPRSLRGWYGGAPEELGAAGPVREWRESGHGLPYSLRDLATACLRPIAYLRPIPIAYLRPILSQAALYLPEQISLTV
ncbi:hypothetical protein GCM10010256_15050 [Streptomyces coeruleorubidus]|nr:hypothetical protein GCM10010256_15050 [Streptomyces coeruleorubidus]